MTWAMKPELPTAVPAVSAPCRVPARESRHKPARGAADSLSPHESLIVSPHHARSCEGPRAALAEPVPLAGFVRMNSLWVQSVSYNREQEDVYVLGC